MREKNSVRVIVKEISTKRKTRTKKFERPTEKEKEKKRARNKFITVLFLSLI